MSQSEDKNYVKTGDGAFINVNAVNKIYLTNNQLYNGISLHLDYGGRERDFVTVNSKLIETILQKINNKELLEEYEQLKKAPIKF
jgi:hypothetical protein